MPAESHDGVRRPPLEISSGRSLYRQAQAACRRYDQAHSAMHRRTVLLGLTVFLLGSVADRVAGQSVVPAASAASASAPTSLSTTGSAAISGTVIDAATGRPAAGAIVSLGNTAALGASFPRAVADSRGRFVFLDLPASDTYILSAIAAGYSSSQYGWTTPNGKAAPRNSS